MSICLVTIAIIAGKASALPPLGVTQIDADPGTFVFNSRLGIFDDTAYVSTQKGIWAISSSGNADLITISHPELDAGLTSVTRVVKGPDDQRFFGATFREVGNIFEDSTGAALYRFDEPTQPLVTWHSVVDGEHMPSIAGIDGNLRAVGTLVARFEDVVFLPAEFFMDGTFEPLDFGDDQQPGEILEGFVTSISDGGLAVGGAQAPGTAGIETAIWAPDGELIFSEATGTASSIRDRNDGAGVNIGTFFTAIYLGNREIYVHAQGVDISGGNETTIVSQSDFTAVNASGGGAFVYYPGLVRDDPLAVLPIEDVFPELASIDIELITDLDATPDGHIFMTLSGADGLYLFGARDPSVIPEPTTWTLLVLSLVTALTMKLRGKKRGRYQYCSARFLLRAQR